MQLKDIMTKEVITISEEETIANAAKRLPSSGAEPPTPKVLLRKFLARVLPTVH